MNPSISEVAQLSKTRKNLWFSAFIAAMHRVDSEKAIVEADTALKLCDEHWRNPPFVGSCSYEHDYPVGHIFPRAL